MRCVSVQADAATDEVYAWLALVAEGKVSAASTAGRCFMLRALLVLGMLAAGASVPLTPFPVLSSTLHFVRGRS